MKFKACKTAVLISSCFFLVNSAIAADEKTDAEPAPTAVNVSGGKINFSGSVVSSACAVDSTSGNISVDLGQIRTASLATAGSESSAGKSFGVNLQDCDTSVASSVTITFTGTPDVNDPTTLAVGSNGSSGSAQNVSLRFYDETGNVIKLGEASSGTSLRSGSNALKYSVKYYSAKGSATAGDASAVATYTLTYM